MVNKCKDNTLFKISQIIDYNIKQLKEKNITENGGILEQIM